eukprot:m.21392 g.21392  ORF g.21392 m.21392 type:complete len:234 (+) comp7134_c0_seq1:164-865(+)
MSKVWVSGLRRDTSKAELGKFASKFGEVERVDLPPSGTSDVCYGFVFFRRPEYAQKMVAEARRGLRFLGLSLDVQMAKSDKEPAYGRFGGSRSDPNRGRNYPNREMSPKRSNVPAEHRRRDNATSHSRDYTPPREPRDSEGSRAVRSGDYEGRNERRTYKRRATSPNRYSYGSRVRNNSNRRKPDGKEGPPALAMVYAICPPDKTWDECAERLRRDRSPLQLESGIIHSSQKS